nr:uncharacterized protein LOC113829503 [Penaeus vannamei]
MTSFVSAVVALGLASLVAGTEFASQLRKCSVDNKNALNTCLKQIMEDLRPRTKTGIPELGLPVLEPMQINNIVFRQGDGAVNVQAKFMQVKVQGLSNYTTSYVNADPQALTLSVGLMVPELRVAGLYDLKGQVIVFPVTGSGPSGLTSTTSTPPEWGSSACSRDRTARSGSGYPTLASTSTSGHFAPPQQPLQWRSSAG